MTLNASPEPPLVHQQKQSIPYNGKIDIEDPFTEKLKEEPGGTVAEPLTLQHNASAGPIERAQLQERVLSDEELLSLLWRIYS